MISTITLYIVGDRNPKPPKTREKRHSNTAHHPLCAHEGSCGGLCALQANGGCRECAFLVTHCFLPIKNWPLLLEPRWPLTAAIRGDPRRSKPTDLATHVPKRSAQPAVRLWGRQQGSRPTTVPPPLLAALARSPDVGPGGHSWSPSRPTRVNRSPQSC